MSTLDVPQLVRAEMQDRRHDRQMQTRQMYTPPLDGAADPHRNFDAFVASRMMEILSHHYPGYPWDVVSNAQQGVVHFGIRVVMGETLRWVIKLAQWDDLNPKLVIDGGGELLERFNLPRAGFEVMSFIEARDNKHRAQVDIGRRR